MGAREGISARNDAFDPLRHVGLMGCCSAKGSLNPIPLVANPCCNPNEIGVVPALGEGNAAPRFHHTARRLGGDLAARSARAAVVNAGDRVSWKQVA